MPDILEAKVDKFTFRVPTDRVYTAQGVWVLEEAIGCVRVGIDDFSQQHDGDVAFASVKPTGTRLLRDQCFAEVETIKAMVELLSPVSGTLVEANPALDATPEIINQDPYGAGWLARVETSDWESDRSKLLEPAAYFSVMQAQALDQSKKP